MRYRPTTKDIIGITRWMDSHKEITEKTPSRKLCKIIEKETNIQTSQQSICHIRLSAGYHPKNMPGCKPDMMQEIVKLKQQICKMEERLGLNNLDAKMRMAVDSLPQLNLKKE